MADHYNSQCLLLVGIEKTHNYDDIVTLALVTRKFSV